MKAIPAFERQIVFFPLDNQLVHCRLPLHIHFKLIFQAGEIPKTDLVLRDTTQ